VEAIQFKGPHTQSGSEEEPHACMDVAHVERLGRLSKGTKGELVELESTQLVFCWTSMPWQYHNFSGKNQMITPLTSLPMDCA